MEGLGYILNIIMEEEYNPGVMDEMIETEMAELAEIDRILPSKKEQMLTEV